MEVMNALAPQAGMAFIALRGQALVMVIITNNAVMVFVVIAQTEVHFHANVIRYL